MLSNVCSVLDQHWKMLISMMLLQQGVICSSLIQSSHHIMQPDIRHRCWA
jgi:hypothetical protein